MKQIDTYLDDNLLCLLVGVAALIALVMVNSSPGLLLLISNIALYALIVVSFGAIVLSAILQYKDNGKVDLNKLFESSLNPIRKMQENTNSLDDGANDSASEDKS